MGRHVVARAREIPPGGRKLVEVKGRPIVLFNLGGEFFALLNRCPHQGGSLCDGRLTGLVTSGEPGDYTYTREGEVIRCPWHAWEFDIRTGRSFCDPARIGVRSYPASREPDTPTDGLLVAETFPVSTEDDLVLVEL
jgi:3-phenylpropionate/trans-cinnamate dioxygenase ferredoxin subunit